MSDWKHRSEHGQKEQDEAFYQAANPKYLEWLVERQDESIGSEQFIGTAVDWATDKTSGENPEQALYKKELLNMLKEALNDPDLLSEEQRDIVNKVYFEHQDVDYMPNKYKRRLQQALTKLQASKYFIKSKPITKGPSQLKI